MVSMIAITNYNNDNDNNNNDNNDKDRDEIDFFDGFNVIIYMNFAFTVYCSNG